MTTTTVLEEVGMNPTAVQEVANLFRQQIDRGRHPGAGLAVYRHGKLAVDLWGGLADDAAGTPVAADTMFILYSSTKPLAAACLHILWERGQLAWDDKVSDYWPEFAKHGKDAVTIRHVLTHRGGFPETPPELSWDRWQDWDYVVECMEDIIPDYPAGQIMAYHPRNFGWVIGELVRRIDGRHIGVFLREEIFDPSGSARRIRRPAAGAGTPSIPHPRHGRLRPAGHDTPLQPPGSAPGGASGRRRHLHGPRLGSFLRHAVQRRRAGRRAHPETGNGGRGHAPCKSEANDFSLGTRMRRSLGLVLDDSRMGATEKPGEGLGTFGHGGAGTSVGWADPSLGLAMAYITNGFRASATNNPRLAAISRAVRAACR